jgi:hypothetical protein
VLRMTIGYAALISGTIFVALPFWIDAGSSGSDGADVSGREFRTRDRSVPHSASCGTWSSIGWI